MSTDHASGQMGLASGFAQHLCFLLSNSSAQEQCQGSQHKQKGSQTLLGSTPPKNSMELFTSKGFRLDFCECSFPLLAKSRREGDCQQRWVQVFSVSH